jgi:hypothetical protein
MARKAALAPVSAGRSRRAVGVSFYSLPLSPYGPDIHQVIEHTFARFKQKLTDLVFNECQKRGEPSLTAPLVRGLVVEVVATKKIIAADVKRLGNDDWVPPPAGSRSGQRRKPNTTSQQQQQPSTAPPIPEAVAAVSTVWQPCSKT